MDNLVGHNPSWDRYFLSIAETVSSRAKCLSRSVGAVVVKDRQILGTGYNGPPSGFPQCEICRREGEESGKNYEACPAVHAELNCLLFAARNGQSVNGATIYCTCYPCNNCLKSMINAGIKEVVLPGWKVEGVNRWLVGEDHFYSEDPKKYIRIREEKYREFIEEWTSTKD